MLELSNSEDITNVLFSAFLNFLDASSGFTLVESSSSLPEGSPGFPRPCPRVGAASSSLESPFYGTEYHAAQLNAEILCKGGERLTLS